MLEGRDIICFCNDWDGDPLSKKHVMLGLARKNRILWVNSIGNRNPRVTGRDLRLVVRKARAHGHLPAEAGAQGNVGGGYLHSRPL